MTERLRKAFDAASRLPEPEQDAIAAWLLEELASESRWQEAFAGSHEELSRLAREALEEHRRGDTKPLDPETM
jgi:hypothetical protein